MNSKLESPKQNSPKKYPVTIRLDEDDMPAITSWKVGGKYKLTMEVEQTSMSKGDEYGETEGKPKTHASFKVLSVSPLGSNKSPSVISEAMRKRVQ